MNKNYLGDIFECVEIFCGQQYKDIFYLFFYYYFCLNTITLIKKTRTINIIYKFQLIIGEIFMYLLFDYIIKRHNRKSILV